MHEPQANTNGVAGIDRPLFIAVIMLVGFGVVMVYSASASSRFLVRQSIYAAAGLFAMLLASQVDYHIYRKAVYPMLVLVTLSLLVCFSPLGSEINGASRWIRVGPITIQPGEAAKLGLVLWLSYSLAKKRDKIKTFSIGFFPHLLIPGALILICLLMPDFGTATLIAAVTFALLFVAGAKLGYILLACIGAAPITYLLIAGSEYRLKRWVSFLNPFAYKDKEGYQLIQSWYGFSSGGIDGVGIGDGQQRAFLPEAHNDFIASIIGEELGTVGLWIVLGVFTVVVIRGVIISLRARDEFGTYVAIGITVLIGVQVLANMGVAMGLLPTKGLNLPLVSYGGSALMISLVGMGILLNISKRAPVDEASPAERPSTGNTRRHQAPPAEAAAR